jgi:PAS domain S-box-containing protein
MRATKYVLFIKREQRARVLRYLLDSLLACVGSLLVTGVIVLFHLYPAIPDIALVYLLVVLALAITRGRYAAILGAVMAFLALAYFIVPPLYTIAAYSPEEWIALFIFFSVAMLTGQLAVFLQQRTEQANRRERETRQLYEVLQATSREAEQAHQRLLAAEQAALREAEATRARLHHLFMEIPAAMAILRGPEHRYEFVNPLALRHRDREDVVGKPVREVLPELEEQGMLAILDEVYTTGTPFVGNEFLVQVDQRGDGVLEEGFYDFVYQPLHTAQGDIEGILIHSVEVTEQVLARRRVEELNRQLEAEKQQLQYSEQKLRSLVESNIVGITVSDIDGRIYETNERLVQMLGYSRDELLAQAFHWQQLIPTDLQQTETQVMQTLLTTGTLPPREKEYLRKDGKRVPVLVAATMIDQQRQHALRVILDISEQKELERRKQDFLCMVSHELRTPLTSIMGFIDVALLCGDLFPRPLSPEAEQLMGKMETGLKRAMRQVEVETRLVEELLEVSRLELRQFELSLHRENLVTIVQETVANQQQAACTRHFELLLPPDEVVPVLADAGRIGQVLTNYLTNAQRYVPIDQPIAVCLEVEGSFAQVSVRDQGPGLTAEQQQRVWERFYQVAAPGRHGPDRGLGLGLAIARAIIEQHQGQVGVQSVPGQGSTFWFTLPIEVSPPR